jgi:hypothetical protein
MATMDIFEGDAGFANSRTVITEIPGHAFR